MDVSRIPPRLPQDMTHLTAESLTELLAHSYPGTEVSSLYVGTVQHGTATKVRLLLTYNEAGHSHRLPPTMLAKCNFEAHSPLVLECARSEAVFYRDLAPELQHLVNAPKCYFAGLDEVSGEAFLLLEDLLARNVTFGFAPRPIDPQVARLAIEMLARHHARWWNSPGPVRFGTAGCSIVTDVWLRPENFEKSMKLPRAQYVAPPLREQAIFSSAVRRLMEDNMQGPSCLLHGDLHLGNCFFEVDGTPGFLDWQGDTRGCWAHDFTEVVISSLSIDDRRNNERALLELYLEQLRSCGAEAPSFDTAWKKYRRNTLWIATAAVCPVTSQFEAVCTAHTQRAMAAVMDLDALTSFDA